MSQCPDRNIRRSFAGATPKLKKKTLLCATIDVFGVNTMQSSDIMFLSFLNVTLSVVQCFGQHLFSHT